MPTSPVPLPIAFRGGPAFGKPPALRHVRTPVAVVAVQTSTLFSYTMAPTIGGNVPTRPIFRVTLPSDVDYGVSQIQIVNTSLNPDQSMTVPFTYGPGYILEIDSDRFTVKVNGVQVTGTIYGSYPLLDPRVGATNNIVIYITALSQPASITPEIDWTSRWAA